MFSQIENFLTRFLSLFSFQNSESEHLGAVCETACNFPLMKLSGQYSEESRVKHISVKEIKKLEENANEKKKKNEVSFSAAYSILNLILMGRMAMHTC